MGPTPGRHGYLTHTPDRHETTQGRTTPEITRRTLMATAAIGLAGAGSAAASGTAKGRLVWATHVSLAPTWFDPAETGGIVTPFMMLYALHDSLMKPMPGNPMEIGRASCRERVYSSV